MNNTFNAIGMHSESDLYLRHGILIKRDMALSGAKIDGHVDMVGASFDEHFFDVANVGSAAVICPACWQHRPKTSPA